MDLNSTIKAWPYLAASAFLAWYLISTTKAYLKLRKFKGPKLAAVSGLWYIRAAISGRPHLLFKEVCDKYGWIARIGPNTLITTDMELYKKMNAVRSPYRRAKWYKAFKFDADRENLFTMDEYPVDEHVKMRGRLSPGYSGKDSPEFESDIDKVLWTLFDLIKTKYLTTATTTPAKPLDFATVIQYFTLDVITSLGLGQPFGYMEDVDKYEYVKTQEENFPVMNFISAVPALMWVMTIPSVQRKAIPTVKDRVGMGKVKAVTQEIVSRRFGEKAEVRQDMIQSFLKNGLTQGEIADESLLQLLAGSDTSATIIRATFISLLRNPAAYKRLQDECTAAGVPKAEIISYARAQQLPYLAATVREGLRHHPAATGLLPRVTPPQGEHHNGVFIPGGTEVGICAWNMHRHNTAVYGEDAGEFNPGRWIVDDDDKENKEGGGGGKSAEQIREMEKAQDLVFGFGRYRCMGERIAKVELHKTIFELMRRFDWVFVDPGKPALERDMNYGLFQQKGMWVEARERL